MGRRGAQRGIEEALAALGASIELVAPSVLLGYVGYMLGRRYGETAAFIGIFVGMFAGLALGARTILHSYLKRP